MHSYYVQSAIKNCLDLKIIFFGLYRIVIEKATNKNLRSKCIEIKSFAFMSTICNGVGGGGGGKVGANLHLESRSKFAPDPNSKNTVHVSKIHLGANCAHEHGFFTSTHDLCFKQKYEERKYCFMF